MILIMITIHHQMKSKANEFSISLRTLFSEWLLMAWIAYSEDHYAIAISWLHILRNPCCYIFSRVWFYELHILRTSVQLCMLQSGESRFCTILFSLAWRALWWKFVQHCFRDIFLCIRGFVTCVSHQQGCKLDCKCWAELYCLFFDFVYAEPMMLSVDISSRLF